MSRTFATYVVSGAGESQVNGTYVEKEQDVYAYSAYSITKNAQFGFWVIAPVRYPDNVRYQSTDATETPDLATWSVGSHGTEPPPTVVAGTPIQGNPDILVSGAGSSVVNGTYEHTGFAGGKPLYTKGSGRYQIVNYGLWLISAPYTHPEWGDIEYPYYQEKPSESGSPATPDLVAEWEIWTTEGAPTPGVNPPPNVTAVPDPAHDIAVDPLTATAGISEPTLSVAHNLRPEPLTSTADISEPTLSQAHKLTADPLVAVAGITEPTLTQVVVVDVAPLTATADITEPTLTQTQSLTVDSLEAEANLSSVTLTQTHALGMVELVASAGLTEPTLTQTHIINVDPLGIVADFVDVDFAQTHVIDIEPLWAQIELSDLTLAQYIRIPTPDCRRLRIGREDRRLTIHAEDRTLTIPREDRTLKIKCCD